MRGAVIGKDGWVRCPVHATKLCRLEKNGSARGVRLWCSRCGDEVILDTRGREP